MSNIPLIIAKFAVVTACLATLAFVFLPARAVEAQDLIPFGGRFVSVNDFCCDGTAVLWHEPVRLGFPGGEMKTSWTMDAYRELFYWPTPGSCAVGFVRPGGVCMSLSSLCLLPRPVPWVITKIGTSFPGCQLTHADIGGGGGGGGSGDSGGGGQEPPEDPDAVSVTLTAEPTQIEENSDEPEEITLDWESENAEQCSSSDFQTGGDTSGVTQVPRPEETTTYQIQCTGEDGSGSDFATVRVGDSQCQCADGGPTEEEARQLLAQRGISINRGTYNTDTGIAGCPRNDEFDQCRSTPTPNGGYACTEVRCLPYHVFDRLAALKEASGCNLTVTGGTEPGHQTHAQGKPIVDLRRTSCLTNFIRSNSVNQSSGSYGTSYFLEGSYGGRYLDEGSHFHAVY